jgi:hypothetical protein
VDFIDACKVVLRRWYVAVPLLLLTFAGTYFAYTTASANYSAKGSLIIIPPVARTLPDGVTEAACSTNRWCAGGDVLQLANVTARSMDNPSRRGDLLDPHPGASYEVVLNSDNRSAIVELSTTAATPRDAIDTLREVSAEFENALIERQTEQVGPDDVTPDSQDLVRTSVVTMANQALPQSGGKLRGGAAAFGLGIAITLGGVFLAESMAVSRRTKASLLDRIALPDQAAGGSKARRPGPSVPDPTGTLDRPNPVSAGQGRSGRVGS